LLPASSGATAAAFDLVDAWRGAAAETGHVRSLLPFFAPWA